MSLNFNGSSQYAIYGAGNPSQNAGVTGYPFTLAAWIRPETVTGQRYGFQLFSHSSAFWESAGLLLDSTQFAGYVFAGSSDQYVRWGTPVANTWYHLACVFSNDVLRKLYVDGAEVASGTGYSGNSLNFGGHCVGAYYFWNYTPYPYVSSYFDGDIAECGLWNVSLGADDIAGLGKGISPVLVQPAALKAYYPLSGRLSPEPDYRDVRHLSYVNSPTASDHPPKLIYPRRRRQIHVPGAVAAGGGGPIFRGRARRVRNLLRM